MAIVIRRLEQQDVVENFECGDDALNNYLRRHAWSNLGEELDRRKLCGFR